MLRRRLPWPPVALTLVLVASGCSRSGPPPAAPDRDDSTGADPVIAMIGDRGIRAAEVDALVAGPLLDLEHQRYLLRRGVVEAQLLRELTALGSSVRTARIALEPPLPPKQALTGEAAATRPDTKAPVTLDVFCDFESPHCTWVQQMLSDLARLYPGSLRVAARDFPMSIHPHAQEAAEAARCAGQQGRYWSFHDLLRARGATLDRAEFETVAKAVGVEWPEFQRCLDSHSQAAAVRADLALGQRLGVTAVPAVFVNGRAAPLPLSMDMLMWLTEGEIARAGAKGTLPKSLGPTRLPLSLMATVVGAPGLGVALFRQSGVSSPPRVIREGESVAPGVLLRRVRADGVELLRGAGVETLDFDQRAEGAAPAPGQSRVEEPLPAFGGGPGSVPVFLDREMVRERMTNRVELARAFEPVSHTLDGYRLLRLTEIKPGSLYELLGLQAGDVIIMVNEQPIHEGDNPLWDALDREDEVRVRVMRRGGLATQYVYRFK